MAVFQKRGADRVIIGAKAQAVADRAAGVANFKAQIPQDIKHRFNDAFGPGGDLVGRQKQQVDIRLRCHFAAPIAADGKDRKAFGLGRIGKRVHHAGSHVKGRQDNAIGQPAIGAGHGACLKGLLCKGGCDCGAAALHLGAKQVDHGMAQGAHVATAFAYGLGKPGLDLAEVKDIVCGANQVVPARDDMCHAMAA